MNLLQRKLLSRFLMNQAGGDGGSGGGGTPGSGGSDTAAQIQAAVDAAVAGLKTKNDELLGKLKTASDQLKSFEGLDPVKVREFMSRIENDAETKLIAEGKVNEVIEKRTERLRADFEKKLAEATAAVEAANGRAKSFEGRVLDDAIRAAATSAGVHAHAVEDALFRGRSMFALTDDGKAVAMKDGTPMLGKDGKTPLSPTEWLDSMRESAPHWFPAGSTGGGASGEQQGGSSAAKTMKRAAFEKLDPAAKVEFSKGGGRLIE